MRDQSSEVVVHRNYVVGASENESADVDGVELYHGGDLATEVGGSY